MASIQTVLPIYRKRGICRYIANEFECDNALRKVTEGPLGLDTEFLDVLVQASLNRPPWFRIDWYSIKLCVVQIALEDRVLVIDVKRMRVVPNQLARILESQTIAKVGVGFLADGRVIWDGPRINVQNLVDVGLMAKLANPERYAEEDFAPLSLERCVKDVLGAQLDKSLQQSAWDEDLTAEQVTYAGLDAQASLEVFNAVSVMLEQKGTTLGIGEIPEDWYSFDCREGKPTRREPSYRGDILPWSTRFCPWWSAGKFQGYYK
ncbi:ribonuclease H-like domain-containing protein [Mycena polygramma]|nr:ribonuclease H-like domain-containing protein [Mycena polygramma]